MNSVVSSFIDSGAGLVLSMVRFSHIVLNSENKFIIAKLMMWVWCIMNESFTCYRHLLTNR